MSSVNQLLDETDDIAKIVTSVGFLVTGSLTGINTFLNFASQYEQHYQADARYLELYTEIQTILTKPKRDRIQADVCMEQIKNKYEHLNKSSPDT